MAFSFSYFTDKRRYNYVLGAETIGIAQSTFTILRPFASGIELIFVSTNFTTVRFAQYEVL